MRDFEFKLSNSEQIVPLVDDKPAAASVETGTTIHFKGIRSKEYVETFPKRADTLLRYFSSQFISEFLMGTGPKISINIDGETTTYPQSVANLTVGTPLKTGSFPAGKFGTMSITGFTCQPESSSGLDGNHQLHLLANGRTVETRKVDNLLGCIGIERDGKEGLVFHGCVSGDYLDLRVNEGRTAFNLTEKVLAEITRTCMEKVRTDFFPEQIKKFVETRKNNFQSFVDRYPIYGFDTDEVQLERVPFHATTSEEFASGLVKYQIRREEQRQSQLQDLINMLDMDWVPDHFDLRVADAAKGIHASEQLALAQHVVRRKLALELLDKLIRRIRARRSKVDDFHLEKTLHSFICPMSIRGDDHQEIKSRAHDLWIIDERLSFTRAFSSDKRLDAVISKSLSEDRPDLLVWDLAYGLGVTETSDSESVDVSEPLRTMMVVEFKKPGREEYTKAEDQIEAQITKYLSQLKNGEIESFGRENIRVAPDCIFYCYVIADIVGDLELQLSNWDTTSNGQGRIRPLKNQYRGSIEVIQWQDLVNDAWSRNRATIHAAGLSRAKKILD